MTPEATEQVAMMVVMPIMFLVVGWVFKMAYTNARQKRMLALQGEMQRRLLEKFDSTEGLVSFMNSEAGRRFSEFEIVEPTSPYAKILGSVQVGIILSLASIGMLVIDSRIEVPGEGLTVVGILGLTIGIGFLISSAVSYALSKSWGLINGHRAEAPHDGQE
jgi:hypothetical protein